MAKKKTKDNVAKENLPSPVDAALSMVSFGKPIAPIMSIEELLSSQDVLMAIAESAAIGSSITSIEMKLGFPDSMLKNWLRIGKQAEEGPFYAFYLFFQRASAEARMQAESRVLTTNPLKWLEMMQMDNQLNVPTKPGTLIGKVSDTPLVPRSEEHTDSVTGQSYLELDDVVPNHSPVYSESEDDTDSETE